MSNGNIIQFPNSNKHRAAPTPEAVKENSANLRLAHIDDTLEFVNTLIIEQIMVAGFNFDFENNGGKYTKDLAMLSESLTALLYKYYGMDHQLHKLSEKLFITKENTVDWAGKNFSVRIFKKDNNDTP